VLSLKTVQTKKDKNTSIEQRKKQKKDVDFVGKV